MEISERALAGEVAAGLERLIGLFRSLSPPDGLSLTAAATLATLERSGPQRLTALAVREGVTQPAMTQLIARLQDGGLVCREADDRPGPGHAGPAPGHPGRPARRHPGSHQPGGTGGTQRRAARYRRADQRRS
jgi:DNA-binding transcriptional ArsR family regulator